MADPGPQLDPGELYDALANRRRRVLLRSLSRSEGRVSVSELARVVADATHDGSDPPVQSTYISLIQSHLPKLDGYGIVEYDTDAKVVGPGPAFLETVECLQAHGDGGGQTDDRRLFQGLSVVTILGLVLVLTVGSGQAWVLVVLVVVHAAALAIASR